MKNFLTAILTAAIALPLFAVKPVTIKGSDTMVIMNARLAEAEGQAIVTKVGYFPLK